MCVEEFELCLKPRGIIWRAHLAYVLSSGVHSAHHHLLDGNGFCQVLDTQTNTLTHDERCPGRAKDRQNNLNISNKHKQAAYCYSYCPVKQWCPHKCINMKSSGERSEVTDPRTHIHTHTLDKLFCTKVFPTHGGWPESRSAYFSWGRITLHLHCPLMLADEPSSKSELSFLSFFHLYFLFISCRNWSGIPHGRADSMSQQWNVTWPIMLTWSGAHAIKLCHHDSLWLYLMWNITL